MNRGKSSHPAWLFPAFKLSLALAIGWGIGKTLRSTHERVEERRAIAAASDNGASATLPTEPTPETTGAALEVFKRLHLALGIQDPEKRERAIGNLADNLDAAQIRAALERLAGSRIPFRKEAMAQLFARWGEIEPLAAMEFALELRRSSDRSDAVSAVLDGWMERDPAAAEKSVRALPGGPVRNAAWRAMITACAAVDRSHAIALAEQMRFGWAPTDVAESIFGTWALDDPQSAAANAVQLSEGWLRTESLKIVAGQWAEADPEQAITWACSLPDQLIPEPPEAAASTTMCGADRTTTVRDIMEVWLKHDEDAVVHWLSELPDDPWKKFMIFAAGERNTELLSPRSAVQLAELLPDGEGRAQMLINAARRMCEQDVRTGTDILTYATDQKSRVMIMSGLAKELKGDDLIEALRQVDSTGASPGTFWRWADPETAARWAAQQPNANPYLFGSATEWMAKDQEHAEEFVRALPVSQRDGVYSQMIQDSLYRGFRSQQEVVSNFEKMSRLIPEIVDPNAKQTAYRKLAARWIEVDAASGRRWLDSIPIPAAEKAGMLKPQAAN